MGKVEVPSTNLLMVALSEGLSWSKDLDISEDKCFDATMDPGITFRVPNCDDPEVISAIADAAADPFSFINRQQGMFSFSIRKEKKEQIMASENELVFLPLGGVGEIGMNLALYGYGDPNNREWIMVDCGVTFPGLELPGVDLVLPDIRFLEEERHNLKAIIITHAHEDHYGALNELWPLLNVPVYVTPFTAGMLEAKRAYERSRREIPVTIFNAGDVFNIGPFEIEAVAVKAIKLNLLPQ